jgi:hypothetical protein
MYRALVPEFNSSKDKKAVLISEEGTFSIDYRFGVHPPRDGYGVPSHNANFDRGIPVCFESNQNHVTILTAKRIDVKIRWGSSAITLDKWSINNAILNERR